MKLPRLIRWVEPGEKPDPQPEQGAPTPEQEEGPDTEPDERAELLDDLFWDADIREEAHARARQASARTGAPASSRYSEMLFKVARERGVPEDVIARRRSEAYAQSEAYYDFLERHRLDPGRPDARQVARDTLAAIEARRHGLGLRLKSQQITRRHRQQYEAELDLLDVAETSAWTELHPPIVAGEEHPGDEASCRCGRGMSRRERFELGRCQVCRSAYESQFGQPWTSII